MDEDFHYYNIVTAAVAIMTFCSYFLTDALFQVMSLKAYIRLPRAKQHVMLSLVPSTIHAILVSWLATYALLSNTDSDMHTDNIYGRSVLASTGCAITAGYMLGDLLYMILRWKYIGEIGFVFHHIMSCVAYIYVTNTGTFRYFAMIRLLAEYSTLFVNMRVLLYDNGLKNSSAYYYNGILMVMSFTLARILPLPFYLHRIYLVHNTPALNSSGMGKYMLWLSTVVLDTLNLYWYRKMIKGALKVLESRKDPPAIPASSASRQDKMKQG